MDPETGRAEIAKIITVVENPVDPYFAPERTDAGRSSRNGAWQGARDEPPRIERQVNVVLIEVKPIEPAGPPS